jgi:DNA uptake protein ComE-like DNA-binding protein
MFFKSGIPTCHNRNGNGLIKAVILLLVIVSAGLAQPADDSLRVPLDVNNATFEEIQKLPVPREIAEKIYERILYKGDFTSIYELKEIEGIDQAMLNRLKPLIRIEPFRSKSSWEEKVEEIYYRLEQWSGDEGIDDAMVDIWIDRSLDPYNVNEIGYEDLINLQNISPVDATAIINYRNDTGEIRSERDLRGVPGLSYYGYRNVRNFLDYRKKGSSEAPGWHGYISTRVDNTPYFADEDAASTQAGLGSLEQTLRTFGSNFVPNFYYKMRFTLNQKYKFGYTYVRRLSEPSYYYNDGPVRIPEGKFYFGIENVPFGGLTLRKLYFGNYSLSFGQGVILENVDFFTPRKSGYSYRKRFTGLSGDVSRTREFTLQGVAAEIGSGNFRGIFFGSSANRDAILNTQIYDSTAGRGFNQLVVLNQRFKYALDDAIRGPSDLDLSWLKSVRELTYGTHLSYDFLPGTSVGFTYYESAYNRPLEPVISEIVSPENMQRLVTTDNEIRDAYGFDISRGTNPFWDKAVSFRRVYGLDFQTVFDNIAIQGEWGELDKGGSFFKLGDDPKGVVLSVYTQLNNFNFLALYRNYDLGYDNPYQRSFSNYRRYKGTIYEDYFYLQSSLYGQLYDTNPQPQAEEGYYLNAFYQFNRNMTIRMEYDNWVRQADQVQQYRLVGTLDIRPVFPVRIQLRQKWQARDQENNITLDYFQNFEFRGRVDFRLSGFDNIGLLYVKSMLLVRPRPRVFGDITPPSEAVGMEFVHNFNNYLRLSGSLLIYKGFLWNFEDTQFMVMDCQRGAVRTWWSLYTRLNPYFALRFKYTFDHQLPMTNISFNDVRDPVTGKAYATDFLRKGDNIFLVEFDYNF